MRLIAPIALCFAFPAVLALGQDDGAAAHVLELDHEEGYVYVTTRDEHVSSAVRFKVEDDRGRVTIQSGSAVDRNEFEIKRTPRSFDPEGGLTALAIEFTKHQLSQDRQAPGESAIKQTYSGEGPLQGALIREYWDAENETWKRTLERAPRTPFGQYPDELKKLVGVERTARANPLLPDKPVKVGESWQPDTGEVERLLKRFGRESDEETKLEASCVLMKVADGLATVKVTAKLTGLTPLKTEGASKWKKGASVTIELKGEFTLDLEKKIVESESITITAEAEGQMHKNSQWLDTTATVTVKTSAVTKKVTKQDDQEG